MDRPLDLQPLWQCRHPGGGCASALEHPWGARHRPDWALRGLIIWPRGGQGCLLRLRLVCPERWRQLGPGPGRPAAARARLVLRWWADRAELRVQGDRVHRGDLFDTACRWTLPSSWWEGGVLDLELRLRSPLHDDGALIHSRVELEPLESADPLGLLMATQADLQRLREQQGHPETPSAGVVHVLSHAHLDMAWLWPVADTWRAAERTFRTVLHLMERFDDLHFGHSSPALYAWLERHRPDLFARIRSAMRAGRWEPLNGPWVESDCVLISTASLLRQFQEGQHFSHREFPEWSHPLAWLPDSFGFGGGVPAVAAATGVRWFCTHKLAWNATNPFPHRLFRWRSRCGAELLALMTAPIGTDGDPLAIERHRLAWQMATGCSDTLWLPGVGDHGGGPTAEMLEQLALWQDHPAVAPQRHGTVRDFLLGLEPLAQQLPVWRDELYLELHRGCATSRPDQKRHNRSLERLLREADLVGALIPGSAVSCDWRPLLFQQFHDILPGTAIPEVFEQAEPQWRGARRRARQQRDRGLANHLSGQPPNQGLSGGSPWWVVQLQPLPTAPRTVRLPAGRWALAAEGTDETLWLQGQGAPGGGQWLQIPGIEGVGAQALWRRIAAALPPERSDASPSDVVPLVHPVRLETIPAQGMDRWLLSNGLVTAEIGPQGLEQLSDPSGVPLLAGPLSWCRWGDRGEFWDAWDIAPDYRSHPLPWRWQGSPQWVERGSLCARFLWRGHCGGSPVRLDGRLLAGSPWLELVVSAHWRQVHELLRLEIPIAGKACRWAADTCGGVIERPAEAHTPRERARWEVPAISWMASVTGASGQGGRSGDGLAVLLDGPQGVSASPERLGISLLRAPTWPDPGADHGWRRQRLALMPTPGGWRAAQVPQQAVRLREPLWCHPMAANAGFGAMGCGLHPLFPALEEDLLLVALRPAGGGEVLISVQNAGPCRRRLRLIPFWRLVERVDGLDRPICAGAGANPMEIFPWQLAHWRLERIGGRDADGAMGNQSS